VSHSTKQVMALYSLKGKIWGRTPRKPTSRGAHNIPAPRSGQGALWCMVSFALR
jgi:hypothetical protein